MIKFFEFIQGEVSEASSNTSDTGAGLSVLVIPSDKIAFLSASQGFVNITFNDCSVFEETSLVEGESLPKTTVEVACTPGTEIQLIENIVNFITTDTVKKVMKFDVREDKSTFKRAKLSDVNSMVSKVPIKPVETATKKISRGSKKNEFKKTIGEIFFGDNIPIIDYNHEGLEAFADAATVTKWYNAGSLGPRFTAVGNSAPLCEESSSTSGIGKKSVLLNNAHFFDMGPGVTVKEDYTIYFVIGQVVTTSTTNPMILYGDDAGETVGFGGNLPAPADYDTAASAEARKPYSFTVRHSGRTGLPATTQTNVKGKFNVPFKWPSYKEAGDVIDDMGGPDVFIVRRDKKFNMFLHNRTGDIIGFIPGKTIKDKEALRVKTPAATNGLTDGDLLLETLGCFNEDIGVGSSVAGLVFRGHIGRFGVIDKDIGNDESVALARDLFNLYNFNL